MMDMILILMNGETKMILNQQIMITVIKLAAVRCPTVRHQPFSLYGDIRNRIKRSLKFGRKSSPTVKVIMPFDPLLFNGGLKCAETPYQMKSGIQHYSV